MQKADLDALIMEYRYKGMPYKDIANKLHVSANYARTVFSRTLRASKKPKKLTPDGFCKFCGKPLEERAYKRNRLFCDDKCRQSYHHRKTYHTPFLCVCEYCGHEFVTYGNPKKRFCSRECQTLAGRKGE